MDWKNLLILLAVIGFIHFIIIGGAMGGCSGPQETAETIPVGEEKKTGISLQQRWHENIIQWIARNPDNPDIPEHLRPMPIVRKVVPWQYGKSVSLPSSLQRQAGRARSVILVDLGSRRVLWEKNSRQKVAVASLTKLMTAILVGDKLAADPEFTLDTMIPITKAASSVERSRVLGLKEGEVLPARDLVRAMMIGSYNDAASQLAEVVSGSVDKFVADMNERASEMGLTQCQFNSPNGLPQGRQRVNSFASAADILHLCETIMQYKDIFPFCSMNYAELSNGRKVYTSNNLLLHPTAQRPHRRKVAGLIGFKTGFTNAAGCCLAFGVTRNGRTVIGCVTGFPSAADRDRFCIELIEWTFKNTQAEN